MPINRKSFFDNVRQAPFGGFLSGAQVAGMSAVLDCWDKSGFTDPRHLAYALSTTYHETGRAMIGVKEFGEGKGHSYGLPAGPYNHIYFGRGLLQLTWLAGYENATAKLRTRGFDLDLVKNPDDALKADVGAEILIFGMAEGWFTGRKLATYFSATVDDPVGARHIINGTDKAALIAGYHKAFLAAITAAMGGINTVADTPVLNGIIAALNAAAKPVSTPPRAPLIPPVTAPPHLLPQPAKPGFWAWLKGKL